MGYVIAFLIGAFVGTGIGFSIFAMIKTSSDSNRIIEAYNNGLEKGKRINSKTEVEAEEKPCV